jgi:hypothetical protein
MYKCNFPGCDYLTDARSQICNHHILSKADGGKNGKHNLIMLCPTCHTKIWQINAKYGIHKIKSDDSIELVGKVSSTGGMLLEYKTMLGETNYTKVKG